MPGEALLHPAALLSVAVLVLNDHWLKARLGADPVAGVVTGKLSDVAGLVFFPLVLASLLELARWAAQGPGSRVWAASGRDLAGAVVVTGVGFAAVQTLPVAGDAYAEGLAVLRWVPAGSAAVLTAAPAPPMPEIDHVRDVGDSVCLPALWVSYDVGCRVQARRPAGRVRAGKGG